MSTHLRPDQPTTVMVWQAAVDPVHRGAGIGARLFDHLASRLQPEGVTHVEASINADNEAIQRHGMVDSVEGAQVRGRGLVQGVSFEPPKLAAAVCQEAFGRGLLMETSGAESEVIKLMPSLLVSDAELDHGLTVVSESIEAVATRELVGAGRHHQRKE